MQCEVNTCLAVAIKIYNKQAGSHTHVCIVLKTVRVFAQQQTHTKCALYVSSVFVFIIFLLFVSVPFNSFSTNSTIVDCLSKKKIKIFCLYGGRKQKARLRFVFNSCLFVAVHCIQYL